VKDAEITRWYCEGCGASWAESWTGHAHCGRPVTPVRFVRADIAEQREKDARRAGERAGWNA
jgi:hypothetical protein